MSNLPQVFNYKNQQVRVIIVNGMPWWVAKDVCEVLDISNYRDAVSRLDEDERGSVLVDTLGGPQQMAAVNEPGLYGLIMTSRKPEAKQFKRWVTHEVLPAIRQTGTYSVQYQIPRTYPEALRLAADLAEANERLKPKAEMHDLFLTGQNSQSMGVVAKTLGIGRNTLFKILREEKILMRNNVPYQKYIDRGYFEVIERPIPMGDATINKPKTLVTARGVDYIGRLLKRKEFVA